ncbi:hypothetical protein VTK73DRAFT_940 [Phialemonium thermophilum]|uniref:Major facilitator superfamily (MFS) profile domain-containing protein n=1 Tax=Phialemonium thermophilum TaxID=223376 RepID=A0ABR3VU64_9PEZI
MSASKLEDAAAAGRSDSNADPRGKEEEIVSTSVVLTETSDRVPRLHAKTYLVIFTVGLIYFAQLINIVGAGSQTQAIASALGGSDQSVWISSPLVIGTVVLSPIVSQAADYWGRRVFLVALTLVGAVGSVIVARAHSMPMAIAGFTVTGLSYGAQPLLHAVTSEILPRRYRSWGQACDLISNGLGGITALLVGGALNRHGDPKNQGFRSFWYMSAVVYLVAAVLTFVLYRPPRTPRETSFTLRQKLAKLDWVGYALLAAGLVLFCLGLAWSDNPYPWSDVHTSAPVAVGLFLVVCLCAYELVFKKDGMLHHDLFRNRNFALALTCLFCEGFAFFAANQYFPFQVGVLYTPGDNLLVGVHFAVALIVSLPAAVLAGLYLAATKRVRDITVLAFAFFVAFFVGMATTGPGDSTVAWGLPVVLGVGLGASLVSLITVAQFATPPSLIATTSGLILCVRSLGGAIGLGVYNAMFVDKMNRLGDNVASAVLPMGLDPQDLGAFIGALTAQDDGALFRIPHVTGPMVGAAGQALLDTYASAFRDVWITASCLAAVAMILSVFLKDTSKEFNMHIDNPVEKLEDLYVQKDGFATD